MPAPLMCAGITTFNSLRNSGVRGGDTVAVLGIGGLGHLAIQFASKMGFRTIAIARGTDKEPLARQLGAGHYIDSTATDPAAELQRVGGARIIVATATSPQAIAATIGGLSLDGRVVVLGTDFTQMALNTGALIGKRTGLRWPSSSFMDRFGRHDEILGDERGAPHDGNVSARESAGGIRPDDEQQGSVPGGPHHWELRTALPSAPWHARTKSEESR